MLSIYWQKEKQNPDIRGEVCPACGKKSWYIMVCDDCGKIFCKHCYPAGFEDMKRAQKEGDDSCFEISCECGSAALFV